MVKITRHATCGSLCLPSHLACIYCQSSISRSKLNGRPPRKIKKCLRPFDIKWSNHREESKVDLYCKVCHYLNTNDEMQHLKDVSTNLNEDILCEVSAELDYVIPTETTATPKDPIRPNVSTATLTHPCPSNVSPSPISAINDNNSPQYHLQTGSVNKVPFSVKTPSSHILVHKSQLKKVETKAEKYDMLMKALSRGNYKGTHQANTLLGFAASCVPQCGYSGLATVYPLLLSSFFQNAGITVDADKIVSSLPSDDSIKQAVTEYAVDTAILMQASILENPHVYLACDKGNKKGNKNLAKFFCWYCKKDRKVRTFLIDVDCVDEDTADIFAGIHHSIKRFFESNDGEDVSIKFRGQCTDSGGGGTLFALAKVMKQHNLMHECYVITSCTLHNLQTALRNAVVNVLGDGGLNDGEIKMNMMQMLHGCYNIQNWHESNELKDIWQYVKTKEGTDLKFKKLEEPVLSRWWLVGVCATSFKESFEVWQKILTLIRNSAPSNSACSKIASCTLNLMTKPVIINDLEMLIAFHKAFIVPHFRFLQLGDPKTGGTPSFLGRHCTLRYYIMQDDLDAIKGEGWKTHEMFAEFVQHIKCLTEQEQEIQQKKLTYFVRYLVNSINKHFEQWIKRHSFLGMFADQPFARSFAQHVMGVRGNSSVRGDFFCKFHNKNINLPKFDRWVCTKISFDSIMSTRILPIVCEHHEALFMIARGADIGAPNADGVLLLIRDEYLHQYAALPTNTQFVERGVKESGYVSLGRRAEQNRTILAIARGKVLPDSLVNGRLQMKTEVEEDDVSKHQLKGKRKSKHLIEGIFKHNHDMLKCEWSYSEEDYISKRKRVKHSLTKPSLQFKRKRIDKKVEKVTSTYGNNPAPNRYQRREGCTLTPLMEGKIQYSKMIKLHNIDAI